MTDTTDIKALRERLISADSVEELHSFAIYLIDQLEAERQRADNASDGWVNVIAERDAAEQKSRNYEQVAHGLAAEIAALKGDHVPVSVGTSEECSPDVYAKGVSACLVDIPKEKAEVICRGISAASGVAVDWHYIGGRVHIKAMRVTAPQKPVLLPGISELIDACDSTPAVRDVHVWDLAISEVKRLNPSLFSDKSAAGGIVKDGE